ncbi:SMI1/KNR4 family protein [Paraburkholderia megapolitana]|uniref:SMI1 / KNR4 family (SUKH-1) n=1 Tax=Paraburkholderia megapolitana TaxID=420953 RepID=A0A1I3NZN4_9BURK|nr:SMI1/KNR4 family protein [Paraburkholderia megapolitana]QDQ84536.1 SMI1/KNR4 family protein [Paraburkholderia megapolitana]SFJ14226.1 SMI1 / KNR4 family (SUKH-1) [Paraburkholderia megapolitana]
MKELTYSKHEHSSVRHDGASDEEIDEFFSSRGLACPADYRAFLQKYNGGCFNEGYLADTSLGPLLVSYFSTLAPSKNRHIPTQIENLDEYIPSGFVPIADDPGGNLYLLDCDRNSERNGKIYFWNHESAEPSEDPVLSSFNNITLLFDSFADFLDAMKDKSEV